jgi:hypothetical protein
MSAGARVPRPVNVGANCDSRVISTPIEAACRKRPVANRSTSDVWFDRMVFSRSFPWRAIVTRLVAGLKAATFWIALTTASRCVRL